MPSANAEKQPARTGRLSNGEGSSSGNPPTSTLTNAAEGSASSNGTKIGALLAAAPRLSLEDETSLEPPSYDDANSVQSGQLSARSLVKQQDVGVGIDDSVEFEYAFEMAHSHEELLTNVVRHPGAKSTILSLQRLALGPRRANAQNPTIFKVGAVPLSANQLEIQAKSNSEMGIKSIKIGMLDIPEDDKDIQFGVIDWLERGAGHVNMALANHLLTEIYFERAYSMTPDILFFMHNFAFKPNTARRVKAGFQGSNQYGFCPRFTTGGTQILDAKATWIAIPKDSRRFDSGMFEVSSKSLSSVSCYTGSVTYTKWKFPKKQLPKVFVGLTGFDLDATRAFRLSVAITGESHEGFSWTVRNWDDSAIGWGASISWIAIANPMNPVS